MKAPQFVKIASLLCVTVLPAAVQAQLTFTTNSGAITITGYNGSPTGLVIPSSTNGYVVVSIGNLAFENKSTLTSMKVPNSVTNIGTSAFQHCTSLTNILLGNTVISIGNNAFLYDSKLVSITLPNSVISIGVQAFGSCSGVTNISVGSGVTNIGDSAFIACYGLTAITVNSANPAYSSVAGVLFDKGQTTLLQFPGGKAGNYVITNGVTSIGDNAFSFCSQLTSVDTSNSVVSIGQSAFSDSTSLTNITLGANVSNIGVGAFGSAGSLVSITVVTNNLAYSSVAGVLFNKSQTTLLQYPPGAKPGNYTPPNSVISIGDDAFAHCNNLTNVTIGNSITSIGAGAFYNCINLTNVTIGTGLASIGFDGFDLCYSLTAINVDLLNPAYSSVAGILYDKDQTTLIRCPGGIAGSCTIPSSVTSIGNLAFLNDYEVNAVYFEGNAPSVSSSVFDDSLTVYFLPGTTGWTSPFGGMPAVLWNPQAQTDDGSFGIQTNQFGFNITGNSNLVVVVEACTNIADSSWRPLQTNTLTSGSVYFSDPQWTNYSKRFYRIRSP